MCSVFERGCQNDKYFKIKDPKHNLTRTRCQIALAKDMRKKMDAMNACAGRWESVPAGIDLHQGAGCL